MGLFNFKKKQKIEQQTKEEKATMSESDPAILANAVKNGIPCIPFIPVNALRQSLTVLKPEGLKGYFIAKIPALYPDGSVKFLLKEEFMLWNVVNSAVSNIEKKGRNYFFIGFEMLMTKDDITKEYLSPLILYQANYSLFRIETDEKLEFFHPSHSPKLELTYIPADHNIHVNQVYVINFLLIADLYPVEEREDPSGFMLSFEQWKDLKYPLVGDELQAFFDLHIQGVKDLLK